MRELLKNAVNGWFAYTDAGKYAVLFLGILVWYWYNRYQKKVTDEPAKQLLIYATAMAVAVLFPPGTVFLMKYQTSFYDYRWIWSVVPVTLVISWGMTKIFLEQYRVQWRGQYLKLAGFVSLGLAVILLCGNLDTEDCHGVSIAQEKAKTVRILDKLEESGDTEDICLWAPREVLAYVRGQNGEICLLYGRNMWEASLNAYAYDVYDQETTALYQWMETEEGVEEQPGLSDREAVDMAFQKGVNCILVSKEKSARISRYVTEAAAGENLTVTCLEIEGYDIYRIRS